MDWISLGGERAPALFLPDPPSPGNLWGASAPQTPHGRGFSPPRALLCSVPRRGVFFFFLRALSQKRSYLMKNVISGSDFEKNIWYLVRFRPPKHLKIRNLCPSVARSPTKSKKLNWSNAIQTHGRASLLSLCYRDLFFLYCMIFYMLFPCFHVV